MTSLSKNSRIFIAGHNGMIGSAFLNYFKNKGFRDIITANRSDVDLCRESETRDFFERNSPEIVIFAAGKVGGIIENRDKPADFIEQNLLLQTNVFKLAREFKIRKLVFFASSCMYPKMAKQPMSEDLIGSGQPEETSIAYATSKYAGLQLALAINAQDNSTSFIPVIPNSVYGPNDNFDMNSSHVLSALIRKFHIAKEDNSPSVELWGTGMPRREFLYVDDLVSATIEILNNDFGNDFLPINIGFGEDISIKSLALKISSIVGFHGRIIWDSSKPDGAPRKLLDSSKIASFGWSPKFSLDEGIELTYKWFVENH